MCRVDLAEFLLGFPLGIQMVPRVQLYGRLASLRNVAAFAEYIFYEMHDEAGHDSSLPLLSGYLSHPSAVSTRRAHIEAIDRKIR
jgi:hypothetical protein